MVAKIINATEAKPGVNIMIEGEAFTVKSMDVSKTGKHGAHKCRIEAVGMINPKHKKVFVTPGDDRFEVPMVEKRRGQVLSIGDKVSIMDVENFETLDLDCSEEIKPELEVNSNVEYWDIEGVKIIKRKV